MPIERQAHFSAVRLEDFSLYFQSMLINFLVHFARGVCHKGPECEYLHRLPGIHDLFQPNVDCFGRLVHSSQIRLVQIIGLALIISTEKSTRIIAMIWVVLVVSNVSTSEALISLIRSLTIARPKPRSLRWKNTCYR